ncbi:MAG: PaaI family thioesterase [Sphingomonadales bacterium]
MSDEPAFAFGEDPDNPGWHSWQLRDQTRYNGFLGPLMVRREGDIARVRMMPERKHTNLQNAIHGGTTLGFIDVALFAASRIFGLVEAGSSVTLDLSTQFIGSGRSDTALDAEIELLRETGRLIFLRGLVVQGDTKVAAFAGTIRKGVGKGIVEG